MIPYRAEGIDRFERDRAAAVCICYVDLSGATSTMRFLIRRLRQRLPDARLLIAIWPKDHPILTSKPQNSLGEIDYELSLGAALKFCVAASAAVSGGAKPHARNVEIVGAPKRARRVPLATEVPSIAWHDTRRRKSSTDKQANSVVLC